MRFVKSLRCKVYHGENGWIFENVDVIWWRKCTTVRGRLNGGDKDYIPFDKLESFYTENLK